MHKVNSFSQLNLAERIKIEVLLHQGLTYSAIAAQLQRSVCTISREVKRNRAARTRYVGQVAESRCRRRHRQKQKHRIFDEGMKRFIQEKLTKQRLSPELISVEGKKLREEFISNEWIYQWIWQMKFSQRKQDSCYAHLYEHLRHAHRRRSRSTKRHNRGNILERHFLEERPAVVEKRKRKGDMECDIMLGKDRKPGLLVMLDRKSRKTWIRHLKSKDSEYVMAKIAGICKDQPIKTITFDNDQSFALHYKIHPLGIDTFFTDPYCSQQKGSVENRIGLIRMFFPKQTDFATVSPQQVRAVETLINKRPLRMFNYKTPDQLYNI